MRWIPDNCSQPVEELMEKMNLPESDRDELRKFRELLRRKNEKNLGPLQPAPEGMIDWMMGNDVKEK